jgi:hypothetical protein
MNTVSSTILTIGAFPFNALAAVIDLFFCIPVIGRLGKWGWNIVATLAHAPFGLIEWAFLAMGKKPEKKLKLAVVLYTKEDGLPYADTSKVIEQLEHTAKLYKDKANIKVSSAKATASEAPSEDWITIHEYPPSEKVLKVGCNKYAFGQDLWVTGTMYQFTALTKLFHTNFRRIIGYGSPVVVYIVEDIHEFSGCSIGPLSDYVTIDSKGLVSIAHEVGHACTLFHENNDEDNLMHPKGSEKTKLTTKQIAMMRASRHITFI